MRHYIIACLASALLLSGQATAGSMNQLFSEIGRDQWCTHRYSVAVKEFVANWTFANVAKPDTTSQPAAVAPKSIGIDGVYLGYKNAYVTVLGVVRRKAQLEYLTLFPDGAVLRYLPQMAWCASTHAQRFSSRRRQPVCTSWMEIESLLHLTGGDS